MKKKQMMYQCIPITGKTNDSFVGIKCFNESIKVFFPESLNFSDSEVDKRREILALIKSISLAKTKNSDSASVNRIDDIGSEFVLDAYLWMINDYMSNGRYINIEKEFKENVNGKINWKRTMAKQPFVDHGNIVYKDMVVEVKHQRDNLLTEIYKYCVRTSCEAIGWIMGINYQEYEEIPFNKRLYNNCLTLELEKTYNDEKHLRLTMMKSIINGMHTESKNGVAFSYGVNDYSFVYERMIDNMFGNVKRIQDYYPNGEWDLQCFDKSFPSSNLRPDTVIEAVNSTCILDSKFYRFGFTKSKQDLPNTSSIQKQITYGEFIANTMEKDNIINAFILPYNKADNKFAIDDNIACIGSASAKWKNQNEKYEKVFALLLDTHYLLMNWHRRTNRYTNEIVHLLEKQITK